ncbi:hypothetical protein D9Q98_000860 [Chlorella vulgaris]|uniref:Uncharacterized protein n=1 Tax=Chlorella vulgaris TaxID=3077 RepID=A0A9D4Z213_CHLVU|nr:hypothetical protein D9Q98_000860 [Chlorella vulgaris]
MNHEDDMTLLLSRAVAQPCLLQNQAGGAALALAIHCLMLRDGFEAREVVHGGAAGRLLKAGSIVPADWNQLEHVWVFEYSRPGADNKFRLACSLQSTTRRMFIHAAEVDQGSEGEPLQDNICVMGLQLDNYVPAGDRCSKSTSWEGVITNQQALGDMFGEFIAGPLWRQAHKTAQGGSAGSGSWAAAAAALRQHRTLVLAAAAGVTGAALVVMWRRRSVAILP